MSIKKCIIVGCGSHSSVVISIIESMSSYEVSGLVDSSSSFDPDESKSGYAVVNHLAAVIEQAEHYRDYCFALALGENDKRSRAFLQLQKCGLSLPNFISTSAIVDKTVTLGQGNIIGHGVVVNPLTVLGNNNLINTRAVIEHDCHLGNHNHVAPGTILCGKVHLSNDCFIGPGAVVTTEKCITEGISVGAGAVVLSDLNDKGATYVGTPAKELVK